MPRRLLTTRLIAELNARKEPARLAKRDELVRKVNKARERLAVYERAALVLNAKILVIKSYEPEQQERIRKRLLEVTKRLPRARAKVARLEKELERHENEWKKKLGPYEFPWDRAKREKESAAAAALLASNMKGALS